MVVELTRTTAQSFWLMIPVEPKTLPSPGPWPPTGTPVHVPLALERL